MLPGKNPGDKSATENCEAKNPGDPLNLIRLAPSEGEKPFVTVLSFGGGTVLFLIFKLFDVSCESS